MDIFTIAMWLATAGFLLFSLIRDRGKTKRAMKLAFGMGKGILGSMLSVIFLIGLIWTFLPPEKIAGFVEKQSVAAATVAAALVGTVTLIPAIIAFPLVGTLVHAGVSIVPAVAFLTTLTMVGVVTFPLEKREFGRRFAAARNGLSFLFALAIAFVMGVIL